jgi:hypothetical protein
VLPPDGSGSVVAAAKFMIDFDAIGGEARRYATGAWDALAAVARAAASQAHPYFTFQVLLADPVTYFAGDREAFARAAEDQAFATHAYLTLDGEWLSPSTRDCSWAEHAHAMAAYVDSLPDDTVLAIVKCHS